MLFATTLEYFLLFPSFKFPSLFCLNKKLGSDAAAHMPCQFSDKRNSFLSPNGSFKKGVVHETHLRYQPVPVAS